MTWSLIHGERIGVELPFSSPPEVYIGLEVEVLFPDTDPLDTYVFPALYYEMFGPGINSDPVLMNQSSIDGGLITLEPGAERLRVYLKYDATPGPLGTLPRGDIRRSIMTIKPGIGMSIPSLGVRVHELILDSGNDRVTMIKDTMLAVPYLPDTSLMPIFETVCYWDDPPVGTALGQKLIWTKFDLTEPPEQSIVVGERAYDDPELTTVTALRAASAVAALTAAVPHLAFLMNTAGVVLPRLFAVDGNDVVTNINPVTGIVPAGTKSIIHRNFLNESAWNGFNTNIGTVPTVYSYLRFFMERANGTVGFPSKNWRMPDYTLIHASYSGENISTAGWNGLIAGIV